MSDKRSAKMSNQPSSSCRKYSNVSHDFNEQVQRKMSSMAGEEETAEMRLKRTTVLTGNFPKKEKT